MDLEQRVALRVAREGSETVWMDVDVGTDITRLELALGQLYGSTDQRAERLWVVADGEMRPIGPENPREHEPIGNLLLAGELHSLTLAVDQPLIRGGQ